MSGCSDVCVCGDRTAEQVEQQLPADSVAAAAAPLTTNSCMVRESLDKLPRGRMVGASLLCYCVDPTWSRIYFLLGKERRNPRWKTGSERWSDFGGRVCSKAESAEDTAAKEFVEETLAMVKYFDTDTLPRTQWQDIADSLRQKQYTFQLLFGVACEDGAVRNYVTFVKQIPWDPEAVQRFEKCREVLVNPVLFAESPLWSTLLRDNPGVCGSTSPPQAKRDYLEKKTLGLWSIPQLQHAIDTDGVLSRKDGKVERCRQTFTGTVELVLSELAFHNPACTQEP